MYVLLRFIILHGLSDQINEVIKDISMITDDTLLAQQIHTQKLNIVKSRAIVTFSNRHFPCEKNIGIKCANMLI